MTDDSCQHPYILSTDGFYRLTANGSLTIPYGETTFTGLMDRYEEKLKAEAADCGGFILEGMSLLSDIRAALFECREYDKPIYVTLDIDGELKTEHELPADAALIVAQSIGASMFGVCSDSEETLIDAVTRLKPFAEIPLYVKPISGTLSDEAIKTLIASGADGFCGLNGECRERLIKRAAEKPTVHETEHIQSIMLANERSAFFLENDTTEISAPLECNAGMSEELLEANDSGCDVLKIAINSPDDALDFTDNAHMTTLPVMFSSDDGVVLKLALMLYQGRALIDSACMIDREELEAAAQKYGALIY